MPSGGNGCGAGGLTLPGIGIFGTGGVVHMLVPFLRSKGFKVEALWGRTQEAAENTARELGIPFWTSHVDDVLLRKDVGLIFVACAPHLHAQIAVKALGIGKHVVCDQPAGLSQAEALKMVHAAQYYPSLIGVLGHGLRFLPAFTQMRKAIQDGYVGQITLCDVRVQTGILSESQDGMLDGYSWYCDARMGGGVLSLLGSHLVDAVTFLTGQRANRVHGVVRTLNSNSASDGIRRVTSPDFCAFQMEMDGGALVTISLCSQLPGLFLQEILVCGNKGHLVIRGGDLHGRRQGSPKEEVLYLDVEDLRHPPSSSTAPPPSCCSGPGLPKPYLKGLLKLATALRDAFGASADTSGWQQGPLGAAAGFEDGQYVQAVLEAVVRASRRREWAQVTMVCREPDPDPLLAAAVRCSAISM